MKRSFFNLLVLTGFLSGCISGFETNNIAQLTFNPKFALPLVNSTFGFKEFLENSDSASIIEIDETGLITLVYDSGPIFSQDAESHIKIPNTTTRESFSFTTGELVALPIDLTITKKQTFSFTIVTPEGDEIDSVFLESGEMKLDLDSNFPASGEAIFRFLSLSSNGVIEEDKFEWEYNGQQPSFDFTDIIDLSDLKVDLTENGTSVNRFIFEVEITLFYKGEDVFDNQSFDLSLELLDFEFKSIFGKIAERSITADADTIKLNFFNNLGEGSFQLDKPEINLTIGNGFGIPVEVQLNSLIGSNDTKEVQLTGSITDPQVIGFPAVEQLGDTIFTLLSINADNSNLGDVLSILPNKIIYGFQGTLNPQSLTNENFALRESELNMSLEIRVPLIGSASNLKATKEYPFDGAADVSNIVFALFQVFTDNGFPFSLDLQIHFLDPNGNVLETLIDEIDQRIVEAAKVDGEGNVTESSQKTVQIQFSADKINRIQDATSIRIEAIINTTNNGANSVKILDNYEMQIKIGMQTEFALTF